MNELCSFKNSILNKDICFVLLCSYGLAGAVLSNDRDRCQRVTEVYVFNIRSINRFISMSFWID